MNLDFAKTLLDILTNNSFRILDAGFGVDWAESSFFDVVKLLRQEKALKTPFLAQVAESLALQAPGNLSPGMVPIELIEVVSHELRWPELKELAIKRIQSHFRGDRSLAASDISTRILEAFRDDWEDRMFYARYKK